MDTKYKDASYSISRSKWLASTVCRAICQAIGGEMHERMVKEENGIIIREIYKTNYIHEFYILTLDPGQDFDDCKSQPERFMLAFMDTPDILQDIKGFILSILMREFRSSDFTKGMMDRALQPFPRVKPIEEEFSKRMWENSDHPLTN